MRNTDRQADQSRSPRREGKLTAYFERDRDAWLIAEHERRSRGEPWVFGPEHLPPKPVLPDLSQVTGWSKAKVQKENYDATRALFGGWRLKDWEG